TGLWRHRLRGRQVASLTCVPCATVPRSRAGVAVMLVPVLGRGSTMADDDKLDFKWIHTPSDHKGSVKVTQVSHRATGFKVLAYRCSLEEDFDGAPQCYGERNTSPVDAKANPDTLLQSDIKPRARRQARRPHRA